MATGRPSKYSDELADRICELIANSERGLHHICKENPDIPSFSTIFKWLGDEDKKSFADKYARAREAQAEMMRDSILEIADETKFDTITVVKKGEEIEIENREWINRSKLRVETRIWLMSKLMPKKYGKEPPAEMGNPSDNRPKEIVFRHEPVDPLLLPPATE